MAIKNKQEKKEIAGKTFIFQHPGLEAVLDIRERSKVNGNTSEKELFKELLEHVVFVEEDGVPRRVNLEYFEEEFDSMKVFTEVMSSAAKFIFR